MFLSSQFISHIAQVNKIIAVSSFGLIVADVVSCSFWTKYDDTVLGCCMCC